MEWWQILALANAETVLQRYLHPHVMEVLDHLVSFHLLDTTSIEYASITRRTGLLPHEQVTEIFRELIAITADNKDGKVFSKLCQAIRNVGQAELADMLQAQAEECKKTGNEEKARASRLAQKRTSFGFPEQTIHQMQEVYAPIVAGEPVRVVTAEEREQVCIAKFRKHLRSLCRAECYRSDMSHPLSEVLREDVHSAYVSMQALSQREALRLARRHKQKAGSDKTGLEQLPECDDGQNSFPLREPTQLLMDDPTSSDKPGVDSDNAATASSRKSSVRGPRKTMLMSDPGKGKTMVCRRVLADFVEEERVGLQEEFDFVIPIYVRDSESMSSQDWSDFLGLDSPSLNLNPEEQQIVLRHLSENSERVLLVMDGIDECGRDAFCYTSAARAFIEQRRDSLLMDASAIITSRPCQQAYKVVAECTAHYRLTGFTPEQLEEFLCRQLGEADGKACMSELSEPSCEHLKRTVQSTPLLATLLCQQYFLSSSVPSCITLFYVRYLCSAIARLEKKRGKPFGEVYLSEDVASEFCGGRRFQRGEGVSLYTVVEHHLEQLVETELNESDRGDAIGVVVALQDLYKLCMNGLCKHKFSFQCGSLPSKSLAWCLDLGLLVNVKEHSASLSGRHRVVLPHLTMQEWCAARGGASSDDVMELTKHCLRSFGVREDRWEFWKFFLGTVRSDVSEVLCEMREACDFGGFLAKKFHLFLMKCLSEHRLCAMNPASSRCRGTPKSSDIVKAAKFLAEDGINLSAVSLGDMDVMALCDMLELLEAGSVATLDLKNCNLSEKQVIAISPMLCKARRIELKSNKLSGAPLEAIALSLGASVQNGIEHLDMMSSSLTAPDRDGASLALCLRHSTLTDLQLLGSKLGNSGLASLAKHMSLCPNLRILDISECDLVSGCGGDIAAIAILLPNLRKLQLLRNKLTNSDAELVLSALQPHKQIRFLNFCDNVLDDRVSRSIIQFFEARSSPYAPAKNEDVDGAFQPCRIYISGNKATEALLEQLAQSGACERSEVHLGGLLVTSTSVRPQDVETVVQDRGGRLTRFLADSSMADLGEFLVSDSTIEHLLINGNNLSDVGMYSLVLHGPSSYSALRLVDVGFNNLHLSGAAVLLDGFRDSSLQCLCLHYNPVFTDVDTTSGDYTLFFTALSEFRHLKCLTLGGTGMQDNVVETLLTTLKKLPSLTFLNLSDNRHGDDIVAEVVSLMEDGGGLEIIDLEDNAITDTGASLLLGCAAVMSMEHVWLSGNPVSDQLLLRRPLTTSEQMFDVDFLIDYIQC